jgi:asparagine synthase (glutamine-hydrolysing)
MGKSSSLFGVNSPTSRRCKKLLTGVGISKDERMAGYFTWVSQTSVSQLFHPDILNTLQHEVLPNEYLRHLLKSLPCGTADLDKMLYLEMETFLPDHNLNYMDKMSMAASIEARVPYLDIDLVHFATTLPIQYKRRGNTTKYLLRKVAERYLPAEIVHIPKTGFGAPVRTWLKTSLKPMMEERLSESRINSKGIFNYTDVKNLIDNTALGKSDTSYTIWSLMAIDSWLDQFTN